MTELKLASHLSNIRLIVMRGLYLLTFIGLVFDSWSSIFFPEAPFETLSGVAISFWASYSLLMGLGVRYPVKMIPLLLLQLFYKSAWVFGTYLPAMRSGLLDENLDSFLWICITAIVLDLIVIPWPFVFREYLKNFFNFRSSQSPS